MRTARLVSLVATALAVAVCVPAVAQWRSVGPDGGGITTLVVDPERSSTLYAGTASGVFKSIDGGRTWSSAGLAKQEVTALAASGGPARALYAATASDSVRSNGVFRSDDGGASWTPARAGLEEPEYPSGDRFLRILSLAVDPRDPSTVWAGTRTVGSLLVSVDRGESWREVKRFEDDVRSIVVDPADSRTIYVGVHCRMDMLNQFCGVVGRGVFCSRDGGASWSQLLDLIGNGVRRLVLVPSEPRTLLVVEKQRVLISSDRGESWSALAPIPSLNELVDLAIDPTDLNRMVVATHGNGLFRSEDAGATWARVEPALACAESAMDGRYLEATTLLFDRQNPSRMWVGTEEDGVFASQDAGRSWSASSRGLSATEVSSLLAAPSKPLALWVATHGNGVLRTADGGVSWTEVNGGLCSRCDRSSKSSWTAPGCRNAQALAWVPFASALLAGTECGSYWSLDGSDRWEQENRPPPMPPLNHVSALAVEPGNSQAVVLATAHGELFQSPIAGISWGCCLCTGLAEITALAITAGDERRLLIADSPWGNGLVSSPSQCPTKSDQLTRVQMPSRNVRVWALVNEPSSTSVWAGTSNGVIISTDAGSTWRQQGLGGLDVRAIAFSPLLPFVVWAGTAGSGVYRSQDGGVTWAAINDGLANLYVNALVFDTLGTTLYAATEGNGVFARLVPGLLPHRRLTR